MYGVGMKISSAGRTEHIINSPSVKCTTDQDNFVKLTFPIMNKIKKYIFIFNNVILKNYHFLHICFEVSMLFKKSNKENEH